MVLRRWENVVKDTSETGVTKSKNFKSKSKFLGVVDKEVSTEED